MNTQRPAAEILKDFDDLHTELKLRALLPPTHQAYMNMITGSLRKRIEEAKALA